MLSSFTGLMRDGVGKLTNLAATFPAAPTFGGLTSFGYDGRGRLGQEQSTRNGGYANAFAYDPANNPTTFANQSGLVYNPDNQRQAPASAGTFTFDNNGNPTTYASRLLRYDPAGRLLAVPAT